MRLVVPRVVWVWLALLCMVSVYNHGPARLHHSKVHRLFKSANVEVTSIHDTSSKDVKPLVVNCNPGVPCTYPETIDFRIIIMTLERNTSLLTLLKSLDRVEGLEDTEAIIEIWVDRYDHLMYNEAVVSVAEAFKWTRGRVRTHVHKQHVGLYGQWIHTWRPPASGKEIALILEDDISVSPYIYHWLKAAHTAYDNRTDVAAYTLQSEGIPRARGGSLKRPTEGSAFMYKLLGTWGFSPHPKIWRKFQDWFADVRQEPKFQPYVDGLMMTNWYKGSRSSMWDQWFTYFCNKYNLYTVYNNIPSMIPDKKDTCLSVNRREQGLHYFGKGANNTDLLLSVWKDEYVNFPNAPLLLEWDGKPK